MRSIQSSSHNVRLSVWLSVPKVVILDYAQTVRALAFHHNVNLVWELIKFLNRKGHQNCTIGSKVTEFLMTTSGSYTL